MKNKIEMASRRSRLDFLALTIACLLFLSACGAQQEAADQPSRADDNNELAQEFTKFNAEPVTLAQACSAIAPQEFSPLCEALKAATSSIVEQCAGMADSEFCATFAGNVYGVVEGCYAYGGEQFGEQARLFCKVADTFVSAAASYCRQVPTAPAEFCALFSGRLIAEAMVERYEASATHFAHQLQRELSADQPLKHTMFASTHNSFNATDANTPPTLSGSDANQRYVLVDQLRMDIRGIELDVHWMPSLLDGGFRATVCHGNAFHVGCTYEKSLRQELDELRVWLDANPDQVIVIDLESNMGEPLDDPFGPNRYAEASADIYAAIGDRLFLPEVDNARACGQGQPLEASINDVRAAGKQVIVYGSCEYVHEGQSLMFDRTDTHVQKGGGSYIGIQAPEQCIFTLDEIDQLWTRFYEDGTLVGAVTGVERQASAEEVRQMARCNINMPSVDHLQPFDGRLQAFIWSWAEDEPAAIEGAAYAIHNGEGYFVATEQWPSELACLDSSQELIRDGALNALRWHIGQNQCDSPLVFAVPRNGLDNEALKLAKAQAGVDNVAINLQRESGGVWTADSQ